MDNEQQEFLESLRALNPQNYGLYDYQNFNPEFEQQYLHPTIFVDSTLNYTCDYCAETFDSKINYRVHKLMEKQLLETGVVWYHPDFDSWVCNCGVMYAMPGITKHIGLKHGVVFPDHVQCGNCGVHLHGRHPALKHQALEEELLESGLTEFDWDTKLWLCKFCGEEFDFAHIKKHIQRYHQPM
jgi:hypothetical protein